MPKIKWNYVIAGAFLIEAGFGVFYGSLLIAVISVLYIFTNYIVSHR